MHYEFQNLISNIIQNQQYLYNNNLSIFNFLIILFRQILCLKLRLQMSQTILNDGKN